MGQSQLGYGAWAFPTGWRRCRTSRPGIYALWVLAAQVALVADQDAMIQLRF